MIQKFYHLSPQLRNSLPIAFALLFSNIRKNLLDLPETKEITKVKTFISAHQTAPGFEDSVCIFLKVRVFYKNSKLMQNS